MSTIYDRALLLHGSKRNEVLSLEEIEQYGRDSFANADYVSRTTGSDAVGAFLIDSVGASPSAVSARVSRHVWTGAQVSDIDTSRDRQRRR